MVPVAQLDRAPDYESGGWEFESLRARQKSQSIRFFHATQKKETGHLKAGPQDFFSLMIFTISLVDILSGYHCVKHRNRQ